MKPKKSKRADLRNRRLLFLEIGFVVALSAAIITFSIAQTEKILPDVKPGNVPSTYVLPPVTKMQDTRPAAKMPKNINVVTKYITVLKSGSARIENDDIFPELGPVVVTLGGGANEDPDDGDMPPLLIVSDPPTFMGGDLAAFRSWVMKQLVYPGLAIEAGLQGKVTIRFVVERDGSVSGIEVDAAPHRSLADEAVRVVSMSPKWEPGRHQGRPVRVLFVLPVDFRLAN